MLTEARALAILFGSSSAVLAGLIFDTPKPNEPPRWQSFREIFSSGYCTAFFGTAIFNWTDSAKVRMQAESLLVPDVAQRSYTSFPSALRTIVTQEGAWSLLSAGIVSACYRDILYSGIRYGAYPIVKRVVFSYADGNDLGVGKKMICGAITGGVGSFIANPTDIVKMRMQSQAGRIVDGVYQTGLYKGQAVKYHNGFQAFAEIYREGGIRPMYGGWQATTLRAAMGTGAQLAAYDHTKFMCKTHLNAKEGPLLHMFASLVAGLIFATAAAPADVIKARYMSEPTKFSGVGDCLVQLVKQEGPLALFRGWTPSAVRICSLFIIMTPIYEQIRQKLGLGWFAS
eukprot:m.81431 g.81431  ORF g.81431 m.81431 type:complete len:342 (+) comp12634_c2_seq2:36-1061(+)